MSQHEEKTLVARIADGDPRAENDLFLRLSERIRFMVRIRLKGKISKEDQEDIVSEIQEAVLLRLRKGGFDLERGKSLEAYIAGIIVNIVGQYYRRLKKEKVMTSNALIQAGSNQENVLSDMIDAERNEKLRKCLKRLEPKYREVLLMRIYEKKSIEEISQKLKLQRRRVSERIHYAFRLLSKECKSDNYFQYYDNSCK